MTRWRGILEKGAAKTTSRVVLTEAKDRVKAKGEVERRKPSMIVKNIASQKSVTEHVNA